MLLHLSRKARWLSLRNERTSEGVIIDMISCHFPQQRAGNKLTNQSNVMSSNIQLAQRAERSLMRVATPRATLSASYWHVQPKSNAKIVHDARYVNTLRAIMHLIIACTHFYSSKCTKSGRECTLLVSASTGMNFTKLAYARLAMHVLYVVAKRPALRLSFFSALAVAYSRAGRVPCSGRALRGAARFPVVCCRFLAPPLVCIVPGWPG